MFGLPASGPLRGSAETETDCPANRVFDFVGYGFFDNYVKWCPQVVELQALEPDPIRPGLRARQVTLDRGIKTESVFEISDFSPTTRLALAGISEPYHCAYQFEPRHEQRTRIAFTFELAEIDLVMRPFQKLIKAALQEGANQTVANIKQLLEGVGAQTKAVA